MKAINYILFVIGLAISFQSCSEDTLDDTGLGTITGIVVEQGSNEPIENAKISTNPATSTVFTDENGEFVLENIPAEEYSVEARKDGLLTQFEGASVLANAEVNLIFEMQEETAGNQPPNTPQAVFPGDGAQDMDLSIDFVWTSMDPENDDLTYQLEIRNDQDEEIFLFNGITDTTYTVAGLEYDTKYFWQISASDEVNEKVLSPFYTFSTMQVPENRIMFTRNIGGNSVIFSQDLEGNEYQLTSSAQNSFRPRRTNSGNKIAFIRMVGGQAHLFTMAPDGSQVRQITSSIPVNGFDLNQLDFSWSNDGAYLLYPNFDKLYRINAGGEGTELIYQTPDGKFISEVAVNDETQTIALIKNNAEGYDADLFTMDFEGNVLTQVLSNTSGAVGGLDLSLRGDQLLYTHDVSGYESNNYRRLDSRMFLYNFGTGETIDLSLGKSDGTNDLDPRFSPNEAEVIFVNTSNDEISPLSIFKIVLEDDDDEDINYGRTVVIEDGAMPDWE